MNPYIIPGLKFKPSTKKNDEDQVEATIQAVCKYLKVKRSMVFVKTRKREVVYARQLCMWFIIKYTRIKLVQIGEHFGGKDHTTVIHSRNTIDDLLMVDEVVRKHVQYLDDQLRPRYHTGELMYVGKPEPLTN